MKYYTASTLLIKIKEFRTTIKRIDIEKADRKRGGAYTKALEQLADLEEGRMELEEISHPDNTLRNIMMLAPLDATDHSTKK
jgi:hypothetical protein